MCGCCSYTLIHNCVSFSHLCCSVPGRLYLFEFHNIAFYFLLSKILEMILVLCFGVGPYGALHHLWNDLHQPNCVAFDVLRIDLSVLICMGLIKLIREVWLVEQHTFFHIYSHFFYWFSQKGTQCPLLHWFLLNHKS